MINFVMSFSMFTDLNSPLAFLEDALRKKSDNAIVVLEIQQNFPKFIAFECRIDTQMSE